MRRGGGEMRLTGRFRDSVGCLWLLGPCCWQPLAVGNSWLLLFPNLYLLSSSYLCLASEEARLVEDARQEAKENKHAQLKV